MQNCVGQKVIVNEDKHTHTSSPRTMKVWSHEGHTGYSNDGVTLMINIKWNMTKLFRVIHET